MLVSDLPSANYGGQDLARYSYEWPDVWPSGVRLDNSCVVRNRETLRDEIFAVLICAFVGPEPPPFMPNHSGRSHELLPATTAVTRQQL